MRFTDGPTAEASIVIAADADTVWELVSDINTPARFSTELQSVEWIDGASGPAVGARFVGHNAHPAAGEWSTTSTVTVYEPLSAFEWRVGDNPNFAVSAWGFSMRPKGDGQVEVTQWCRMGPGPSGLTAAIESMPDKEERIIARRMAEHTENMQRNLEGLKAQAESRHDPVSS